MSRVIHTNSERRTLWPGTPHEIRLYVVQEIWSDGANTHFVANMDFGIPTWSDGESTYHKPTDEQIAEQIIEWVQGTQQPTDTLERATTVTGFDGEHYINVIRQMWPLGPATYRVELAEPFGSVAFGPSTPLLDAPSDADIQQWYIAWGDEVTAMHSGGHDAEDDDEWDAPLPPLSSRLAAEGWLLQHALVQLWATSEEHTPEGVPPTCCPHGCCGACAALLWYADHDREHADAAVRATQQTPPDEPYGLMLPDGGIDWEAVTAYWVHADKLDCAHAVKLERRRAEQASAS